MLNAFLETVSDRGMISPRRLSDALRMGLTELSRVTHLHRNTLANNPGSEKVQARLSEIARIVAMAESIIGDKGRAIVWFRHQPLSAFELKTAEQLVSEGHADAVRRHLEMLSDGVYS